MVHSVAVILCHVGPGSLHVTPHSAPARRPEPGSLNEPPGASSLLDLLGAAGLNSTLTEEGPFTLFAPSNDAFAKVPTPVMQEHNDCDVQLPVEMVDSLTADTAVLQQVPRVEHIHVLFTDNCD